MMNPQELMDIRDHLMCLKGKTITGANYDRIVESIRVVQREINLLTTDYVRGTRIPIFKRESDETKTR